MFELKDNLSFYLQTISQPAFMAKPDAVWTEEERKQFKEYKKKVKELNEEKEKYRKVRRAKINITSLSQPGFYFNIF